MNNVIYEVLKASLATIIAEVCPECKTGISVTSENARLIAWASSIAGSHAKKTNRLRVESIFNHLNGGNGNALIDADGNIRNGLSASLNESEYRGIIHKWQSESPALLMKPEDANSLLELAEDCFSGIACGTDLDGRHDISLYRQAAATAAIACALKSAGVKERTDAIEGEHLALYALDFSGIQKFIYTIATAGAMKGLRSRSLYLSLFTENLADTILEACGFSRANLIYAGGGRAYLLLPNDPTVLSIADDIVSTHNHFLMSQFDTALYIASAYTEVSGSELNGHDGKDSSFSDMFYTVSRKLSDKKLKRYSWADIQSMNTRPASEKERECLICGSSTQLRNVKGRCLCESCLRLEQFSAVYTNQCDVLQLQQIADENALVFPGVDGQLLYLVPGNVKNTTSANRIYSINKRRKGMIRLKISRYSAKNDNGYTSTFTDLAEQSTGIRRLGVFRCDVDNLGTLFANGFTVTGEHPRRYYNLARYSALSGALTHFFQGNIDAIIDKTRSLFSDKISDSVSVVYAGGDDVFLIGAWDHALSCGTAIHQAFTTYTGNNVTLSAGFCLNSDHEPVTVMASRAEELENNAKAHPGKNSIALFGTLYDRGRAYNYVFPWQAFTEDVIQSKLKTIKQLFDGVPDKGNAFLYHVIELYRDIMDHPTSLARLAYLLARHIPAPDATTRSQYEIFMKNAYQWATDINSNKAFRTAAMLYVYLNREKNKHKE